MENPRQSDELTESVKNCIGASLQLGGKEKGFTEATPLLGDIPELDSMAVLTLLGSLEEYFGIVVDDDDVSADTFETVGSLVAFVRHKLKEQ